MNNTDDEILEIVQACKDGKEIQVFKGTWRSIHGHPVWNFAENQYRVAPEPRKPREWWIEPLKYGLCIMSETASTCALYHVREVID